MLFLCFRVCGATISMNSKKFFRRISRRPFILNKYEKHYCEHKEFAAKNFNMPTPKLTSKQLEIAKDILSRIRGEILKVTGDDQDFLFALRRKIAKELIYDERGKPMHRKKLKEKMWKKQKGACAICKRQLSSNYTVLDRFSAPDGYKEENVQLICEKCDRNIQQNRKYS